MAFTKITNQELNSRGATTLPDAPTISANALKQEFDAPAKEIVAPKFNNLIDELEATTAASSIGMVAPEGRTGNTVQAVVNNVSSSLASAEADIDTLEGEAHTHDNKALLDTYTQTEADLASAVADDHTHSNKSILDLFVETAGELFYGIKRVVNNAVSKIKVGSRTVATNAEDTIEFVASTGMTIFADEATKTITFASGGSQGGGVWGAISGDITSQQDLQDEFDLKANLNSPALTGAPTAPTAAAGTNTTQLATTAFVQTANSPLAPLASPALTGTPTAPTAAAGTNTTQLATTAFVRNEFYGLNDLRYTPQQDEDIYVNAHIPISNYSAYGYTKEYITYGELKKRIGPRILRQNTFGSAGDTLRIPPNGYSPIISKYNIAALPVCESSTGVPVKYRSVEVIFDPEQRGGYVNIVLGEDIDQQTIGVIVLEY